MIDFRYHLVSIVAVFLALAIGLVLGATELQGHTIDVLQASSNSLKNSLDAAEAQSKAVQDQENASEQYLQTAESRLIGGLLPGDSVVIVTEPGAQGSVVDGISKAVALAGATVTGQVALQPKFNDLSGATQSSLSAINTSVAGPDDIVLGTADDPQTEYQQQAAQLIADAVVEKTASQPTGLSPASAQALLSAYAQGGYLTTSGTPYAGATLAVLVTPQSPPADGANDPANQVLLAVAQEFATESAATVVAGATAGSSQAGSAIAVLRSSSVSSEVSSVDDADTPLGQILLVEALYEQLAGGKPNSYGISGASSVSPLPVPTPSMTVTQTPTPNPTATGKGKKPVKKT